MTTAPVTATSPAPAPPRRGGWAGPATVVGAAGVAVGVPLVGAPPWLLLAFSGTALAAVTLLPRPDTALRLAVLLVLLPPGLLPATVQSAAEVGSIALAAAAAVVRPLPRPRRLPLAVWLVAGFVVWNLLSTWWSDEPTAGVDLLRRYVVALLLLLLVVLRTRDVGGVERLMQTLALAGWVLIACGAWAVVTGHSTPEGRLQVFDMNPNQVGNVLLLVTAGVMWQAVGPSATPSRTGQGLAFLGLALALIALSASRGSLLAYVLLLLGFALTRTLRRWGSAVAVLCLVLLLAAPGLFGTAVSRFRDQDPDQLSRGTLWASGVALVADHPLGAGVGRGPYLMPDYIDARVAQDHFATRDEYPAHNPFIEVGTDTGLVGVLLFGGAVTAAAAAAVGAGRRAARRRDASGLAYAAVTGTASVAYVSVWLKSGGEAYAFTTYVLLALWVVADAAQDRARS